MDEIVEEGEDGEELENASQSELREKLKEERQKVEALEEEVR